MHNPLGSRTLTAGLVGIILGGAAEALINRVAGRTVVTDGFMWGAVLAIALVSMPTFAQMGALTVKSDKTAVNFVVGLAMFTIISLVIISLFFGFFALLGNWVR
ncbi:MAG: hypothetical protein FJ026_13460 [Chloroflexi bacterium]|nr:hypothetical protein [Chloroflexota bacterium]